MTELQAYNAMTKLFQIYYDIDPSGDIGGILGSMVFFRNGRTVDLAMLEIWTECLEKNLKHKNLKNYNYLTSLQVFLAIDLFLESFFGTTGFSSEIEFIKKNVNLAREKKM